MNLNLRPFYLVFFVLYIVFVGVAAAGFTDGEICVKAEIKELSPSYVDIDEEFILAIDLESCGSKAPEDITFE